MFSFKSGVKLGNFEAFREFIHKNVKLNYEGHSNSYSIFRRKLQNHLILKSSEMQTPKKELSCWITIHQGECTNKKIRSLEHFRNKILSLHRSQALKSDRPLNQLKYFCFIYLSEMMVSLMAKGFKCTFWNNSIRSYAHGPHWSTLHRWEFYYWCSGSLSQVLLITMIPRHQVSPHPPRPMMSWTWRWWRTSRGWEEDGGFLQKCSENFFWCDSQEFSRISCFKRCCEE